MTDKPLSFSAPDEQPADRPLSFTEGEPVSRETGPLTNAPDETELSGGAKNLATTIGKGLSHYVGQGGDLVEWGRAIAADALSRLPGQDTYENILGRWNRERDAGRAQEREQILREKPWYMNQFEWEALKRNPSDLLQGAPTGEDVYGRLVKPSAGEYTPTSGPGRYARAVGETAIPALLSGGLKAGLFGGAAGATTQGLVDLGYTSPLLLTGAGVAVPSVLGKVFGAGAKYLPQTPTAKAKAAREIVLGKTENPEEALAKGRQRIEAGAPDETLAEATQDPAHAAAQEALIASGNQPMVSKAQELRGARNAQITGALKGLGPIEAAPEDVSKGFLGHLNDLEDWRDEEAAKVPQGLPANEAGAALAENAAAVGQKHRQFIDSLYRQAGLDKLRTWTGDLRQHALDRNADLEQRPLKQRSALADEAYSKAAELPDSLSMRDLVDFDQSLTTSIKKAQIAGDLGGLNQLRELKGRVKDTLKSSVEQQHMHEREAVARGELNPEASFAVNLSTWQRAMEADRAAWLSARSQQGRPLAEPGAAGAGAPATGATARSGATENRVADIGDSANRPADAHVQRPAATGEDVAPGNGGMGGGAGPSQRGTGSPADAARLLAEANQRYGEYKDTFTKGPVGQALETETGGNRVMQDAAIADKAFAPGPKGYETAQAWLNAGGQNGLARLKDVVYGRLQSELAGKNKELTPQTLDAWRGKYADALRAIDEQEPGFSRQFNTAALTRQAVEDFQKSEAGKFLKLDQPNSIRDHVGSLLQANDGPERIAGLMQQAKQAQNGEAIVGGLRRAGADWLAQNFTLHGQMLPGDVEPVPVIGGAGLKKFIATRRNVLDALFDHDAIDTMAKNADQIDRSTMVRTLGMRLAGSPTAHRGADMHELSRQLDAAVGKDAKEGNMSVGAFLDAEALMEGGRMIMHGQPVEGVGLAVMAGVRRAFFNALDRYGIRNRADIARMVAEGFADRNVGVPMLEQAINEHGMPNQRAFDKLAQALAAQQGTAARIEERPQRAEGGRVQDPQALAKKMIEAVETARQRDARRSEPLLKHDDNLVATALAIANRSV